MGCEPFALLTAEVSCAVSQQHPVLSGPGGFHSQPLFSPYRLDNVGESKNNFDDMQHGREDEDGLFTL